MVVQAGHGKQRREPVRGKLYGKRESAPLAGRTQTIDKPQGRIGVPQIRNLNRRGGLWLVEADYLCWHG